MNPTLTERETATYNYLEIPAKRKRLGGGDKNGKDTPIQ